MSIHIHPDQVPLRVDERGDIRVAQSHVLLDTIVNHFKQGMPPDDIARGFPSIGPADVYAVLAYYLRHQVELDEYLRQRDEEAEQLRQKIEAAQPPLSPEARARMEAFRARRDAERAAPAD
jgi:uncharacterized protein (DUF433 family)